MFNASIDPKKLTTSKKEINDINHTESCLGRLTDEEASDF